MVVLHDKETNVLLSLLSFCLFQSDEDIAVSSVDWGKLIISANEHVVTALLYPGIKVLQDVPSEVFDLVQKHAVRASARRERIAVVQQEIQDMFAQANIPCAVLKGMAIETCYPYPELRLPGDIDILISETQVRDAAELLIRAGYLFGEKNDIHASYMKKGVHVEVHNRVSRFPDNPKGHYTESFLAGAEKNTEQRTIGKSTFPMLAQPYQAVSLLTHMERHMCASGIGLRQLCDWAVTVHNMRPDEEAALMDVLDKCGMLKFAKVMTKVCEIYLHLPERLWTSDVQAKTAEALMTDILSAGNFQAQQVERPFCSAVMDPYDLSGTGKSNMLHAYYRRVERKMRTDYQWAKYKILIPLFCIFYPAKWLFDVLTKKRVAGNILATIRMAKKREKLLRQLEFYR